MNGRLVSSGRLWNPLYFKIPILTDHQSSRYNDMDIYTLDVVEFIVLTHFFVTGFSYIMGSVYF